VAQLAKARAAFEVDVKPDPCCMLYCSASGNEAPVYHNLSMTLLCNSAAS
jgi:hypothetical protein